MTKKLTVKQFMALGNNMTWEEVIATLPDDNAQATGYIIYMKGYKDAMKYCSDLVHK